MISINEMHNEKALFMGVGEKKHRADFANEGMARTLLSTPPKAGLNRRKGVPQRSCSWSDMTPGIIFKLTPEPNVCCVSGHIQSTCTEGVGIPMSTIVAGNSSFTKLTGMRRGSTPALSSFKSQRAPRPRSASVCSPFANLTADNLSSRMAQISVSRKSDSRSYPQQTNESAIVDIIGSDADEDDEYMRLAAAVAKRRNSHCSPNGNVGGSHLAHLVPNRFLMNVSRRISTHNSASGCSCSSCGCTVTPYWRDGWHPDIMLCNACGLRYQKFARHCDSCRFIPRKEDSIGPTCPLCHQLWS